MSYDFNEDVEAQVERHREELRYAQERGARIRVAVNWFVTGVLTYLLLAYTFKRDLVWFSFLAALWAGNLGCGVASVLERIEPSTIGIGTGAAAASDSPHDGLTDAQRRRQLAEGLTVEEAQRKDVKP